jgi:hypothetical protein
MTTGLKRCCKCEETKPVSAFGRLSAAKDGLSYACLDCNRAKMKAWVEANKAQYNAAKDRWAAENPEKIKQKNKKYYAENKEKCQSANAKWAQHNKSKVNQRFAKRRASKRQAIPAWLSAIELAQIQEMYDVAAAKTMQTGIAYHVDHIHPLQGNGFNGLHVPWNLRVVSAHENQVKSNNPDAYERHLFWENAL